MSDNFENDVVILEVSYTNTESRQCSTFTRGFDTDWVSWDDLLTDFINFLSGIYGYDIREQVQIKPTYEEMIVD